MRMSLSRKSTFATRLVLLAREEAARSGGRPADFSGEAGEVMVRYGKRTADIFCGLGSHKERTPAAVRAAAAKGMRRALELKRRKVSLALPAEARAGIEGALLGAYAFVKYKSEKPARLDALECVGAGLTLRQARAVEAVCSAVSYARDLVNENASVMTPQALAREARAVARQGGMRVTVLDEKGIARKGLGLLAAVGQASSAPPRLIVLEYTGRRSSKEKTAIVGKGITFDSGGQNLKPTGHIESMRLDMAGAAAVLGAMKAVAALRPKVNVIGCVAAAHNAIGSSSYFPGDIYSSLAGKTVEICSTDAEGRLVLADAIAYCIQRFRPAQIIDLATLTGGILFALGEYVAGLFSNDDRLSSALFASGEASGERLWRFPLYKEYRDSLKGDFADLRNLSGFKKGYAGSITGAAFIQEFVGDVPWAHLDIAGTAWNEGEPRGEVPKYATGFGVRLLVDYLTKL
ncbi:MAG: leucyl aminopeptidase [Chitinispirillaceae bacterium]|nr:leucyl aminopeptidase [Chitinispirillaceae bacterium]